MDFGAVVESYRWSIPNSRQNGEASWPPGSPASPPVPPGSRNGRSPAVAGRALLPLVRARDEATPELGTVAKTAAISKTGHPGNRRRTNKASSLDCRSGDQLSRYWSPSDDCPPLPLLDIGQPSPACGRNGRVTTRATVACNGRAEPEENGEDGIRCVDSAHPESRRGKRRCRNKGPQLAPKNFDNGDSPIRYWSSDDSLPVPLFDIGAQSAEARILGQLSPSYRQNCKAKPRPSSVKQIVEAKSEEKKTEGNSGHKKQRQRKKAIQLAPMNSNNNNLLIPYWSSDDCLPVTLFDIGAQSAEARVSEQLSPYYRRSRKAKTGLPSVEQIVEAKPKEEKPEGISGHKKQGHRKKAAQLAPSNSDNNNPLIQYWSSDDCLSVPSFDVGVRSAEARLSEKPSPSFRRRCKAKAVPSSVEQIVEAKSVEKKPEGNGGHRKKAAQLTPMNSDNNNSLIQYWSSDDCLPVTSFDIGAQSAEAGVSEQLSLSFRRSRKAKAVPSSVEQIVEAKSIEKTEGDGGRQKRRQRKKATQLAPTNSDNNNLMIEYWSSDDSLPVPSFDIEARSAESRVLVTDRRKKPPNSQMRRRRSEPIQTTEPHIGTTLIPNLQQQPEATFSLTTPPETVMEDRAIEFNSILNVDWSSDVTSWSRSPKRRKKAIKRSGQSRARNSLEANRTKKEENCSAEAITSSPEIGSKRRKPIHDKDVIGQRTIVNKDWIPPVSVHALIQEDLYKDPWKVLVACMLLNKTTGAQMRQVIWNLFDLCPSPEAAVAVDVTKIEQVTQPLGLQHKRARMLRRFSHEYLSNDWSNVSELHGIGKYARDAYAIFCEGRWREVEPEDHKLKDYWLYLHATDGLGYAFHDDRDKS